MLRTCLISCIVLLFAPQLPAQFQAHVDYATGATPFSVAVGDFSGDGKLDLAVTNSADNTVSVLLGDGDRTFQAQVDYATGVRPTSVVVADFNGDGKLDLAITNCTSGTLSVLLGRGDGTFQPHVDYATQATPQWLAVADLNGDSELDLVTANYDPNTVSIFLGNGDGTFQPQTAYAGGISPFGVMAGDFNRDGATDLAVVNNNGQWGVSILLGNGDGSFRPPVLYPTGSNPRAGVVGDFNSDGNLDLAVANCIDNSVSVLMGNGDGTFQPSVNYAAGVNIQGLTAGDFDGDGKLDLVTANNLSDSVSALMGNSDGTFQAHVDFATGSGPMWAAVGDFNGDGSPDLVVANIYANSVSILLNTNAVRTTTTTLTSSLNPAAPYQLVTYMATVTSQYGREVTGTVAFKDGATTITTVILANRQAAFTTRYGMAGAHAISATYSGDADNSASTSSILTEYIQGSTKTLLVTSQSSSCVGQPVTFTATVTSKYGAIPDGGIVTFYDGLAMLGQVPLAGGNAMYTTSALSAKTHTIKAIYAGENLFKPSSATVKQIVNKYATATSLASSPNPSRHSQAVIFTAMVVTAGSNVPTGKVKFMDGTVGIGSGALSGGVARLTNTTLAVGRHSITAQYLGDSISDKSTSPVLRQVVK